MFVLSYIFSIIQADIIVFPEDGLTGFEFSKSEYFQPFCQQLPDTALGWNACQNKGWVEKALTRFYLHCY